MLNVEGSEKGNLTHNKIKDATKYEKLVYPLAIAMGLAILVALSLYFEFSQKRMRFNFRSGLYFEKRTPDHSRNVV